MNLNGKHVLVLGLGESGLAAACWCARQGARVRVADTRAAPPYLDELRRRVTGADSRLEFIAGEFDKALLAGIDLLVLSPGLSGGLMVVIHARASGIPVLGEIELFAQGLRALGSTAPVLAITGTNGKTTTTALSGHLLRATGKTVGVAGNISPAALTALMDAQDVGALPQIWVLELSSFQLETTETLNPMAATVLNISDDHLDRYIDLDEYASAKARVFKSTEGAPGVQVLNRADPRVRRMALADRRIISFGLDAPATGEDFGLRPNRGEPWLVQGERFLLPVAELPLAGLHNAANAMAALALCASLGFDANALLPALRSFRGLPHRVEKVAELDGVSWYDDSKGTNVGATVAALNGIGGQLAAQNSHLAPTGREAGREGSQLANAGNKNDRKIILVAGGDGKGQDFSPLGKAAARHARAAVLIGRDGPLIEKVLGAAGVAVESAGDMEDAVRRARVLAQPGDAVLLSPACASFDMFRNYEHRAQVFVAAVRALEAAA
ncbi:MAG: UDP-N-acetylmuramoylalanine--D-glutamate ligase [Rhodocyclales bacterium RIFCSPLOWO2_02_FULL_63_24]|nr:MAG: UDP-N-acetylmuramoylalanine--D-glutamate ligase [Rhodocyclales bacterium RIFCSPLOWO2_02_FULL_63_24]